MKTCQDRHFDIFVCVWLFKRNAQRKSVNSLSER